VETILDLRRVRARRNQLVVDWAVGGYGFETALWYDSVDFDVLQAKIGAGATGRLIAHIALFEIDKGVSLRPDRLVLGRDVADIFTPRLAEVWQQVVRGVWGQWRFENDEPDYAGPALPAAAGTGSPTTAHTVSSTRPNSGDDRILVFCGGGKDSLVALTLLDRLGLEHDSLAYSHSVYGPAEVQHALIDALLDRCHPRRRHREWIFDQMLEVPVQQLRDVYRPRQIIAGETPASVFGALPLAAEHGFGHLVVAHERSANSGNLTWDVTGETVNHQWGKSYVAERLLADYISSELAVGNEVVRYWSILQQAYDPLIFSILQDRLDAVPFTHSCNVAKPWCMRCPKCAYVWINYKAWLPWSVVDPMFAGRNLLDDPENQTSFRQMLGLADHTPFECVGQVDEVRLAFSMCRARGLEGAAMTVFSDEVPDCDWAMLARTSLAVSKESTGIPAAFAADLTAILEEAGERGLAYATGLVG
jgi:hypothetical protein